MVYVKGKLPTVPVMTSYCLLVKGYNQCNIYVGNRNKTLNIALLEGMKTPDMTINESIL